jgi:catechol 2,3-dioxygenase-like lactoylglutathione lyase family enzyme
MRFERVMFSHVYIGIKDFSCAFDFYSRIMDVLGYELKFVEPEKPWAVWKPLGAARPLLLIGRPDDGRSAAPGNGQMVALLAPNRRLVDLCHEIAIASGGTDEGGPALRTHYHPNFYGAYFRDPDGNKLCVCRHDPETD